MLYIYTYRYIFIHINTHGLCNTPKGAEIYTYRYIFIHIYIHGLCNTPKGAEVSSDCHVRVVWKRPNPQQGVYENDLTFQAVNNICMCIHSSVYILIYMYIYVHI